MEENFKFENLQVYQKSLTFINVTAEVLKSFPKDELFALTSQFRRASYSIALNIAEGTGGSDREYLQFLKIARRSVRECVVCIEIAKQANYIADPKKQELKKLLVELSRMLSGLCKSILNKLSKK